MDIDLNNTAATLYRKKLGETLRKIRINKGYSIPDIIYMTGLSKSTVTKVESGDAKTIDSYINYSVSVEYPFATFHDFNIKPRPIIELSPKILEATKLTAKIRQLIIERDFLNDGRTVSQIRNELARLKKINPNDVTSSHVAGVMRNLANDNIVKVGDRLGRKNVYMSVE